MSVSAVRRIAVSAVVTVGLLVCATAVWAAQSGPQPSSEPERAGLDQSVQARSNTVIGDDPDENGYTGPIPVTTSGPIEPSEASANLSLQDMFSVAGPDQRGAPDSLGVSPEWTDFYYFFAAGSVFRPRDSATGWDYAGAGCISARGGSDNFTLHLEVPHGARIDYLRIFFYDTNASNSTTWITDYDAQGTTTDLISVSSTGTAGYGTALSSYLGHVVDTANHAYVLIWHPGAQGTTMRLCGLRVAYRLPT